MVVGPGDDGGAAGGSQTCPHRRCLQARCSGSAILGFNIPGICSMIESEISRSQPRPSMKVKTTLTWPPTLPTWRQSQSSTTPEKAEQRRSKSCSWTAAPGIRSPRKWQVARQRSPARRSITQSARSSNFWPRSRTTAPSSISCTFSFRSSRPCPAWPPCVRGCSKRVRQFGPLPFHRPPTLWGGPPGVHLHGWDPVV